jgi:hypothetical protein
MNKLDLIIEALEFSKIVSEQSHKNELIDDALADLRELRELKPVAWAATSEDGAVEAIGYSKSRRFDTPLYALGESNE